MVQFLWAVFYEILDLPLTRYTLAPPTPSLSSSLADNFRISITFNFAHTVVFTITHTSIIELTINVQDLDTRNSLIGTVAIGVPLRWALYVWEAARLAVMNSFVHFWQPIWFVYITVWCHASLLFVTKGVFHDRTWALCVMLKSRLLSTSNYNSSCSGIP